jgi:hypothetical protein
LSKESTASNAKTEDLVVLALNIESDKGIGIRRRHPPPTATRQERQPVPLALL